MTTLLIAGISYKQFFTLHLSRETTTKLARKVAAGSGAQRRDHMRTQTSVCNEINQSYVFWQYIMMTCTLHYAPNWIKKMKKKKKYIN